LQKYLQDSDGDDVQEVNTVDELRKLELDDSMYCLAFVCMIKKV
jgi:hypothetical protein